MSVVAFPIIARAPYVTFTRDLEGSTRIAALAESSFALPARSGRIEIGVLGYRDEHAGPIGPLISALALPVASPVDEEGVRRDFDLGAGISSRLPVASIAVPSVPERVQIRIRRHFDGNALTTALPVATVALPAVSVGIQVGIQRHGFSGIPLRRRKPRPGGQCQQTDQESKTGASP
jgi:predicted acylesterase/phospholipase RssA